MSVQKTQAIRLADIGIIGPVMIGAAMIRGPLPGWIRLSLFIFGGATIIYNGFNYAKQQKALEG